MKSRLNEYIKLAVMVFVFVMSFSRCSTEKSDETILVKVGDKTISLNEFQRRAEYTVRPKYCNGNTPVHKRIILNSLIAEKLLSLEAGDTNSFMKNENVKLYLEGRKEQAMRQMLYNKEIASKANVDTNRIRQAYKYAGRKYNISYVNIQDTSAARQIEAYLKQDSTSFENTFKEYVALEEIPQREVVWKNFESPAILNALFTMDHKKGEVVGPVDAGDNQYIFIKINGWTNTPAITEKQAADRYNLVKETYEKADADVLFGKHVKKLMKGKELKFNKEVFFALADVMGPLYMQSKKDKEEIFEKGVWNNNENEIKYKDAKDKLERIKKEKLYSIDNRSYTVEDFLGEIKKHPLVFRERQFSRSQFGQQFQLAILDMVRDKYLTKEAYDLNLDESTEVLRDQQMWYDNINAMHKKYEILKEANADSLYASNYMQAVENVFNPVIDSLQAKYSEQILMNVDRFAEIKLTVIDMAVNYTNYPFPQVVPGFPIITSDYRLDYGSKMK